jgi:hypothetical protein
MRHILIVLSLLSMASSLDAESAGGSLYQEHCLQCHGPDGRGDGVAAADLATAPADLTRIAARRDGVWPMLEVMAIIDGYSRNTLPRADMPVFEEFLDNEMVEFDSGNGITVLVPTKLVEIATFLLALQDPAPESFAP